ncbi:MAG TPA: hypothetical protein P5560_10000 [Thermotogota bacterium]|nr:hypothetical protein [Thermotogota bacterium]HRW93267.1 hypothetical protein [Thermotogota bacterium]
MKKFVWVLAALMLLTLVLSSCYISVRRVPRISGGWTFEAEWGVITATGYLEIGQTNFTQLDGNATLNHGAVHINEPGGIVGSVTSTKTTYLVDFSFADETGDYQYRFTAECSSPTPETLSGIIYVNELGVASQGLWEAVKTW